MADEKSPLAEAREAFAKVRSTLKKTEATIEQKTGAVMGAIINDVSAFGAGALHEAFGKMDERTGTKQIRLGGVNVGFMARCAGLGAELLEAGGKNSEWLGVVGNGIGGQFAGDQGRAFTRQLQKQRADKKKPETKAEPEKPAETATKAA